MQNGPLCATVTSRWLVARLALAAAFAGGAPAGAGTFPCAPAPLLLEQVPGAGFSAPVCDTPLHPGGSGRTYVVGGSTLYAFDNGVAAAPIWQTTFTQVQATAAPVPAVLSGSGAEVVFLVADGSILYELSAATGAVLQSLNLASGARSACPSAPPGNLQVLAPPAVQLCARSNAAYTGGAPCTDSKDLVIVPTHFVGCPGGNRVFALRASDLALPGPGGAGAPGWVFGDSTTFVLDPAADACALVYDVSDTAPPLNNTVVCGTDQADPLHDTLWALGTRPAGASANQGARLWSVDGGHILGRPTLKPGTTRLYYGTADPGGGGTLRVKSLLNGSDLAAVAVASPIAMPVWPEYRPPDPGLTNMAMVTTADGIFRRFVEVGGVLAELPPTTGRPSSSAVGGAFRTGAAVLPSAGRAYLGEDNGTVRQLDLAICDLAGAAASEGYLQLASSGTVQKPALDVEDATTSIDLDRLSVLGAGGELRRLCVPFGDGSAFSPISGARSVPPLASGCVAPEFAGDCTCDAQCANYAPPSPCYSPVCQLQPGAKEGICALARAPNGTSCDNGNACDCDPAHVVGGHCDAACAGGRCDVCTDGVCVGTFRGDCACVHAGDRACDASRGESCCGSGVCADLRTSAANCGQCGRACAPGAACKSGACVQAGVTCASTWVGTSGDWTDPAHWSSGVPGSGDHACIGPGGQVIAGSATPVSVGSVSVAVGADLSVADFPFTLASASSTSVIGGLHLDGAGGIDGPGSIEIPTGGAWTWSVGPLHGAGTVTIDAGATATLDLDPHFNAGGWNVDSYRPIVNLGAVEVVNHATSTCSASTSVSLWPGGTPGEQGGSFESGGSFSVQAGGCEVVLGRPNVDTPVVRFLPGSVGTASGGHVALLKSVSLFAGTWSVSGAGSGLWAGQASGITDAPATVTAGAGATFAFSRSNAHFTGSVSGAGTFCVDTSNVELANPAALAGISLVNLTDCGPPGAGAGALTIPLGTTATVQRLRTEQASVLEGGGTLTVLGDGDPATEDLAIGGFLGGGVRVVDATLVLAHGASGSISGNGTAQLEPPQAADRQSALVNHGTLQWRKAGAALQGRTRVENAADGVIEADTGVTDSTGPEGGIYGPFGRFLNAGRLELRSGAFRLEAYGGPAVDLGGAVEVFPGAALEAVSPVISGTLTLDAATASLPGGALRSAQDIGNAGLVSLGPGASFTTDGRFSQTAAGALHFDLATPSTTARVQAATTAELAGALDVATVAAFSATTTPFELVLASAVNGTFTTFTATPLPNGAWAPVYAPATASVVATFTPPPPTLSTIEVTPGGASVAAGLALQYRALGGLSDGSTVDLTATAQWTVSGAGAVARISASGLLTGVAAGTATVTATSGAVSGSATVTVLAPRLGSIAVMPSAASLEAGRTQQFTATGTFSDGSTADLTGTAAWSASPSSVGTISAGGLVTAVAAGALAVTASSGAVSGGATLTVTQAPAAPSTGCASAGSEAGWLALLAAACAAARRRSRVQG